MREWIAIILVSLLFGTIVSILISWLIAVYQPAGFNSPRYEDRRVNNLEWMLPVPDSWPVSEEGVIRTQISPGMHFLSQAVNIYDSLPNSHYFLNRLSHGWPYAALSRYEATSSITSSPPEIHEGLLSSQRHKQGIVIRPPFTNGELRVLPVVPTDGFLRNVFFWGLVSLVSLSGFNLLRRQYRIRNAHCICCGYTLAGLETCPECGTSAKPRRMQA